MRTTGRILTLSVIRLSKRIGNPSRDGPTLKNSFDVRVRTVTIEPFKKFTK